MKIITILTALVVGFLVLGGFEVATVTSGPTLLSQKQLETRESENLEKLQSPVIVVHVREIYGTLDNPQYRPLANVKVKISDGGLFWMNLYWSGTTDENGTTEEIKVIRGFCYKVFVSKYSYHAYKFPPWDVIGIDEGIKIYDSYFIMAENGSPFVKQISQSKQQSNSQSIQQSSSISSSQNIMSFIPTERIDVIKTNLYDGTLSGYVTDSLMNPIEGALVRVYFHGTYEEDYSDENGSYQVTNIPICYCLKNATCFKVGYKTEYVLLSITENTTYDFVLTPNNPPSAPTITGPINGKVGIEYVFRYNAIDPDNDDVKYEIKWGDGKEEVTDFYSSGEIVSVSHVWNKIGTYIIMARAKDEYGSCSDWGMPPLPITITKNKDKTFSTPIQNFIQQHSIVSSQQSSSIPSSQNVMRVVSTDSTTIENHPPTPPIITSWPCYIHGHVEFYFRSFDLDGDDVSYYIEWGDGTSTGWSKYYPSGAKVLFTHTFRTPKVKILRARAKDTQNETSKWSYYWIGPNEKDGNLNTLLLEKFQLPERLLNTR